MEHNNFPNDISDDAIHAWISFSLGYNSTENSLSNIQTLPRSELGSSPVNENPFAPNLDTPLLDLDTLNSGNQVTFDDMNTLQTFDQFLGTQLFGLDIGSTNLEYPVDFGNINNSLEPNFGTNGNLETQTISGFDVSTDSRTQVDHVIDDMLDWTQSQEPDSTSETTQKNFARISCHKRLNGQQPFNQNLSHVEFAERKSGLKVGVGKTRQFVVKFLENECSFVQVWLQSKNNPNGDAFAFRLSELEKRTETEKNRKITCLQSKKMDSQFVFYLLPIEKPLKQSKSIHHQLCFNFFDSKGKPIGKTICISNIYWAGHKHESENKKAVRFYEKQQNSCLNVFRAGDYFTCASEIYTNNV